MRCDFCGNDDSDICPPDCDCRDCVKWIRPVGEKAICNLCALELSNALSALEVVRIVKAVRVRSVQGVEEDSHAPPSDVV